jgi:hypothetical protein
MDGGALASLLPLLADQHPLVATKAVLGLSALVRHCDPALEVGRNKQSWAEQQAAKDPACSDTLRVEAVVWCDEQKLTKDSLCSDHHQTFQYMGSCSRASGGRSLAYCRLCIDCAHATEWGVFAFVWCVQAFRLCGGLEKLLALLGCQTHPDIQQAAFSSPHQPDADQQQQHQQQRRLQRKVLALLQYVFAKHPTDGFAAAEFGVVPRLQALLSDADTDMRAASLAVLAEVVSTAQGWQWVRQHQPGLLTNLQYQQQQGAGGDGLGDAEGEELQLLQRLVQVLQSGTPPQATAQGLSDHIELDLYQVGLKELAPRVLDECVIGAGA